MRKGILFAALLTLASSTALGAVFTASGPDPGSIQATVDAYRTALGALNANVAGSFPSGRREINWDGVPDASAAPTILAANFFNVNSPRGVVFTTPGAAFQVSADSSNPTMTPIEFADINPSYLASFTTFSAQRLFTALGSNITDVHFFVPGSTTPATTSAFGAVFTDVDVASATSIQYFDAQGTSLGAFAVPALNDGLSFLGVTFTGGERVARVRITSGNSALGPTDLPPGVDVAVMDDFIYAEPQGGGTPTSTPTTAAPTSTPTSTPTPTMVPPTSTPTSTPTPTMVPPTSTPTSTPTPTIAPPTFTPTAIGGGGPAPGSIPTLSPGMLAVLALALAAVSVLLIRRP